MPARTTDVVIIGAGIIGLCIAHQLRRRSDLDVVVLEKGTGLGDGSTGGSASVTRQRYSQPEDIRLARDGNRVFANWAEFTGLPEPKAVYRPVGVLWIMGQDRPTVAADVARLRAEDIDAVSIDATELKERFPALSACNAPFDLTGERRHECREGEAFLLEQDSGYFDATEALQDLADAVELAGIDLRMRTEVTDVLTTGSKAYGVKTADGGRIHAGTVINAAGPWCNGLNRLAGFEMPWTLVPTRVQVIYRELPAEVVKPIPVVGDASTGIYFRPESGGQQILMGSTLEADELEEADPDTYNRNADRSFVDSKIHALHHRIPSLPHRGTPDGMAGVYTINREDVHPVIGPTPIDGFVVVNGFSGHGFKEAPMVGAMVAEWITGERARYDTDVDMGFYSHDRDPIPTTDKNVLA
ncbi:MAG: NAD(P)/FAD-dependent oxidoreductase [Acidimicrobiia bacterium]